MFADPTMSGWFRDGTVPEGQPAPAMTAADVAARRERHRAHIVIEPRWRAGAYITGDHASHIDLRQLRFRQINDGARPLPSPRYHTPGSRSACVERAGSAETAAGVCCGDRRVHPDAWGMGGRGLLCGSPRAPSGCGHRGPLPQSRSWRMRRELPGAAVGAG